MNSVSIDKYKKLLELCCGVYPELKSDNIKIIKDDMDFCVDLDTNEIHIQDELESKFNYELKEYISCKFNLNLRNIPTEVFAFFHEIGHVFHNYIYYVFHTDFIKDNIIFDLMYLGKDNSFSNYRNIYYEYLADTFAADIILNYEKEILNIIN